MPSQTHKQLLSIYAELEKDWFKGLEMRELNDTENFTSQAPYKPI